MKRDGGAAILKPTNPRGAILDPGGRVPSGGLFAVRERHGQGYEPRQDTHPHKSFHACQALYDHVTIKYVKAPYVYCILDAARASASARARARALRLALPVPVTRTDRHCR